MIRITGIITTFFLLYGCAATVSAPIQDESMPLRISKRIYTVLPGDTLYSVAWETGEDYRQIAAWNGIPAPYRITVGERLRLMPPRTLPPLPPRALPYGRSAAVRVQALPALTAHPPTSLTPLSAAPPVRSLPLRLSPIHSWIWPVHGAIVSAYGGRSGNKGIDIAGNYGEPIRASARGRVVYVGSGLPGYGKLIIINDNNDYLSAYAHNAHVDVREGGMVRQGQIIATMGDSGTDRVELHFEIRHHGDPVDPMFYLPKIHH